MIVGGAEGDCDAPKFGESLTVEKYLAEGRNSVWLLEMFHLSHPKKTTYAQNLSYRPLALMVFSGLLALSGCGLKSAEGAKADEDLPSSSKPEPQRREPAFLKQALSSKALGSTALTLSLPDSYRWKESESFGQWYGLSHQGEPEELLLRSVSASASVSLEECKQEVSLSLSLLRSLNPVNAERKWQTKFGAFGQLSLYPRPDGGVILWGVAVEPRHCLSLVYIKHGPVATLLYSARFIGAVLPTLQRNLMTPPLKRSYLK